MHISFNGNLEFFLKSPITTVGLGVNNDKTNAEIIIPAQPDFDYKANEDAALFVWPGEYESRGVMTTIFEIDNASQRAVKILLEEISIGWLDELKNQLTEKEEEKFGTLDVLLISAKTEPKILKNTLEALEPSLVLPADFTAGEEAELAKKFGFGEIEPEDILKLKRSDLNAERMEFKILQAK
jgi:hypothetical protein